MKRIPRPATLAMLFARSRLSPATRIRIRATVSALAMAALIALIVASALFPLTLLAEISGARLAEHFLILPAGWTEAHDLDLKIAAGAIAVPAAMALGYAIFRRALKVERSLSDTPGA